MKNLNLKDFGAKPDGVFNNGEAFKTAFEEIAKNGGGKLTVDAGNWLTGPIDIPSDTTLELSEGARIVFVDDSYGAFGSQSQQSYNQQYNPWGQKSAYGCQSYQDDPFWQWAQYGWKNDNSQNGQNRTYYYKYEKSEKKYTRAEWFRQFLQSAAILLLSMYFMKFSFFIIPIGPILCIAGVIKGLSGMTKSLKGIFARKTK